MRYKIFFTWQKGYDDKEPYKRVYDVKTLNFYYLEPQTKVNDDGVVLAKHPIVPIFPLEIRNYYEPPLDGIKTLNCSADDHISVQLGTGQSFVIYSSQNLPWKQLSSNL